jgi:hypothetical protein
MDHKQIAATIDKLVSGMRGVIDEMSPFLRLARFRPALHRYKPLRCRPPETHISSGC